MSHAETVPEPRIRVYRPGDEIDAAALAAVNFDCSIRDCYEPDGCALFLAYILPAEIARRQGEGCQMFLAELGGRVAGVLELREFRHISMLFVAPEFHRRGIASRLLDRALRLALRMVPELKSWTVYAAPGAVGAYRRWGFRATGPEEVRSGVRFTPMELRFDRQDPRESGDFRLFF